MFDLLKPLFAQITSHVLGRGFRVEHIRELCFERLQTMHLLVELTVRESRHIEYVVLVVRLLQLLAQSL